MRAAEQIALGLPPTGCRSLAVGGARARGCRCEYCLEIRRRVAAVLPNSIGAELQRGAAENA